MRELFLSFMPAWTLDFVYLPYMLFVWVFVEWVRYQVDNIDNYISPKHLTLLIGFISAVTLYFCESYFEGVEVPIHVLGFSFLVTTWFYDYGWKLIKEKVPFLQNFTTKQKQ